MSNVTNENISAIDKAIQAAQARKAKKASAEGGEKPAKAPKEPKPAKEPKRPRVTDEEREARKAKILAERAERKAAREEARNAKRLAASLARKPAHMSKVEKAAARLPALSERAQNFLNDVTVNMTAAELSSLAAHIQHFNRVAATSRALGTKVSAGDTVRVISGDPRFIGSEGTVEKAQRIRCYVAVAGSKKPLYLFTSDVELVSVAAAKTGTDA